ncbi:MAG: hypothetical protein K2X27_19585 [Candidatus Obscuribacterales bacterium]|nr:hypothetical protein [Candidatus Obscuribacterales bacterium]
MTIKASMQQLGTLLVASSISCSSVLAQGNNFINEGKGTPGYMDPNARFVVLNSGVANMAAQQFGLPKDTFSYPLAGMTIFPYYQASAPLKEFLNNASIGNVPIYQLPVTTNVPQVSLPPTDLVRRSIPIPNPIVEKRGAVKMNVADKKMRDEVPWMVAHQGGQAFQIPGDNEALALVAPGSMFSACASRTMVLRCGLMWILTGARPAAVLTKNGAVAVKPYSIAAVEATWFNQLKVANLSGANLDIQLAFQDKTGKVSLEHARELTVVEKTIALPKTGSTVNALPESEISRLPVIPGLEISSANLDLKNSNLLGELKAVSPPFNNPRMDSIYQRMFSSYGITMAMRREAMQKQVLQKYNIASKTAINKLGQNAAALPAADNGPRSFPKPSEELKTLRLRQGLAKFLSNSEINIESNGKPTFASGEAIFVAEQPLVIRTSSFTVHMRAGSKVQMSARQDVVLVRNIGEEEPGSVKIRMGNHIFDCGVGGELAAGTNAPALFDEMKSDGVARRNLQSTEAAGGSIIVNKCEVSLTSLMQYCPIMRKLYKSGNAEDKELVSELMKTIVAINMVTGTHGNYRRMAGLSGVK